MDWGVNSGMSRGVGTVSEQFAVSKKFRYNTLFCRYWAVLSRRKCKMQVVAYCSFMTRNQQSKKFLKMIQKTIDERGINAIKY